MTWAITAVVVAAAGVGVAAHGQYQAGKAQEIELKRQAEQEKLAAEGQELQRRQELNKVLAANALAFATSGVTGGTPESLSLEASKKIGTSEAAESLSSRLRESTLKRQAKSAARLGGLQSASTLLQGTGQMASLGSSKKV